MSSIWLNYKFRATLYFITSAVLAITLVYATMDTFSRICIGCMIAGGLLGGITEVVFRKVPKDNVKEGQVPKDEVK